MQPEKVNTVLAKIFQEIEEKKSKEGSILETWEKVAGKGIARHSRPISLQGGTLIINVDRSAWLYELNLCRPLLMRRLKKELSHWTDLRELRFRIGSV